MSPRTHACTRVREVDVKEGKNNGSTVVELCIIFSHIGGLFLDRTSLFKYVKWKNGSPLPRSKVRLKNFKRSKRTAKLYFILPKTHAPPPDEGPQHKKVHYYLSWYSRIIPNTRTREDPRCSSIFHLLQSDGSTYVVGT